MISKNVLRLFSCNEYDNNIIIIGFRSWLRDALSVIVIDIVSTNKSSISMQRFILIVD
jgi:hypothetical protein